MLLIYRSRNTQGLAQGHIGRKHWSLSSVSDKPLYKLARQASLHEAYSDHCAFPTPRPLSLPAVWRGHRKAADVIFCSLVQGLEDVFLEWNCVLPEQCWWPQGLSKTDSEQWSLFPPGGARETGWPLNVFCLTYQASVWPESSFVKKGRLEPIQPPYTWNWT